MKICGICRRRGRAAAAALGAAAHRLRLLAVRARASSTPSAREPIAAALPPYVTAVGVFVDQPVEQVIAGRAASCKLGAVQLHGDEIADDYRSA